jgi:hypothetical protein
LIVLNIMCHVQGVGGTLYEKVYYTNRRWVLPLALTSTFFFYSIELPIWRQLFCPTNLNGKLKIGSSNLLKLIFDIYFQSIFLLSSYMYRSFKLIFNDSFYRIENWHNINIHKV